jgi:hypothetical protein
MKAAVHVAGIFAATLFAAAGPALAGEAASLAGLDECIAAALQQRPGVLFGWRVVNEPPQGVYKVSVLSEDGRIGDADCSEGTMNSLRFENRLGLRRIDRYREISLAEAKARNTAPLLFAGTIKLTSMEIDTNLLGKLSYEYRMLLPTGHRAMSQVDVMNGALSYAEARE